EEVCPARFTAPLAVAQTGRAAALGENAVVRTFCEPSLDLALPAPVFAPARRIVNAFSDSLADARGSELALVNYVERPSRSEVVRLRIFSGLRSPGFPSARTRALRSMQVSLEWNPTTLDEPPWRSEPFRKRQVPITLPLPPSIILGRMEVP